MTNKKNAARGQRAAGVGFGGASCAPSAHIVAQVQTFVKRPWAATLEVAR